MKATPLTSVALLLLLTAPAYAGSRESAFLAHDLLGPEVWSRVVRIENQVPVPDPSAQSASAPAEPYPAEFYGLVIAYADILWFYTEFDGTQNLSSRRGQLAADRARLDDLLREVDPRLLSVTEETERPLRSALPETLPNACFVSCLKHWQALLQAGHPPRQARLIACYPPHSRSGHMILVYRLGMQRFVFDPDRPAQRIIIPFWSADDPLTIASRALRGRWPRPPEKVTTIEINRPNGPEAHNRIAADPREGKTRG